MTVVDVVLRMCLGCIFTDIGAKGTKDIVETGADAKKRNVFL